MNVLVSKILILVALGYLALCVGAFLLQKKLIFFPARGPVSDPSDLGIAARKVSIPVNGSVTLSAWWAGQGNSPYTLIWCHGNAGNIEDCAEEFQDFIRAGIKMILFDYRGYGESTGSPSARGIEEDALAVYDFLVSQGVEAETIVPYGRSIGSGAATHLACLRAVAGLILVQPFTSTLKMGRAAYPFLPERWILKENLDNEANLARYQGPLLVLHGDRDEIVPFFMGRSLYESAASPMKRFVPLEGGDHNHIGSTHKEEIIRSVKEWLDSLPS